MVLNKRDLERAFSPKSKPKKVVRSANTRPLPIENLDSLNSSSKIKVFVRVRPLKNNVTEESSNQRSTIKVIDEKMLIFDPKEQGDNFFFHGEQVKLRDVAKRQNKDIQFVFDKVFDVEANNYEVHEGTTQGIISTLLEGFNCSVFVYGATGAGKTHTMLGNKDNPGVTLLTMTEMYRQIDELKATKDVNLGITYLEIYNENVHDLINPSGPMHLRDDCKGGVLVAGLKMEKIMSAEQLFKLLQKGNSNRTQHPTDANAESSRSHAVFQVYVKIQTKATGEVKLGKLSMIDLAGSERGSASGCKGARFKEGSNINKSLLALGNCINSLADGLRHIPYRDSKLTRILKDSLGGNCKTVMIANVSPSTSSYEDTYNTLKYAARAKNIKSNLTKNAVSVNLRVEHYVSMNSELKKENIALKEQVAQLEQALRHPTTSPPRADPRYVEKLNSLCQERRRIHTDWLTLEAHLKVLQWRIKCKILATNQMKKYQMSCYDADYNEELMRNKNSLAQLEARANSLAGKMSELEIGKNKLTEELNKFNEEMREAKVYKLLHTEANLNEVQCQYADLQIQQAHHQKLIRMQEKRLQQQETVIDTVSKISNEYHLILKGRNLVTDIMNNEYQMGLMKVKQLKSVTWKDMEEGSDEDEDAALSYASVRPYTNLSLVDIHSCVLPCERPELTLKLDLESDLQPTFHPEPNLNETFVLNPEPPKFSPPKLNTTIVKSSKMNVIQPKMQQTGWTLQMRRKTPGKMKFKDSCKENTETVEIKYTCPLPVRPKSILGDRQVNVQEGKTPVSLNGFKMIRDKGRIPLHNQHPYTRTVKLKRLGSTPVSISKKPKIMRTKI